MEEKSLDTAFYSELFGGYTALIMDLATFQSRITRARGRFFNTTVRQYSLAKSRKALTKLCQTRTPIANNLLHLVAKMNDGQLSPSPTPRTCFCCEEFTERNGATFLSYERHRRIALDELRKRGNPIYDESAYLDRKAWET